VIRKRIDDFVIQELKQLVSRIDEINLAAKVAKHRCILSANNASAINGDRCGLFLKVKDGVAVENSRMVKVNARRTKGTSAWGQHKVARCVLLAIDFDRVFIDESSDPSENGNVIAIIKRLTHRNLAIDDRLTAAAQLIHRRAEVDAHRLDHRIGQKLDRVGDRVTQRFAGDRSAVRAASPNLRITLRDRDPPAALGGLHRRAFATRPRSNHEQVKIVILVSHRAVVGIE